MRHLKAGRKLGRNASHRLALMRNLARGLFLAKNGRIITTVEKAKEARPFVEKLITLAKKGDLHARRLALMKLPDKVVVATLFSEIGPRYHDRPGGYTRIIKRHERRLGDGGHTAFLELLKEGETKVRQRVPAPPAPRVSEPTPPAPATPATPESQAPAAEVSQTPSSEPEKPAEEKPESGSA